MTDHRDHRSTGARNRPGHRKRAARRAARPLSGLAASLTLAGVAATLAGTSSAASPRPTPSEVQERVDALHHEAEQATERYNGATASADRARAELDRLRDQAARRTAELNRARDALGGRATAQYRAGGLSPALQLALSSTPDDFLDQAAVLDRAGDRQADAIGRLRQRLAEIERLRDEADQRAEALAQAQQEADEHRRGVESRLAEAERLLATLTAAQRARVLGRDGHGDGQAPGTQRADRTAPTPRAPRAPAADGRAAQAVAFAYAQLGKPYGWGATGPGAYDCSGLTQAAWRSAGVELPRTSYAQIGAGARISRDALRPGDLVFYYAGVSHVALYVGGGQIVHAARPGTPIRVADVDSMPFSGAVRPG